MLNFYALSNNLLILVLVLNEFQFSVIIRVQSTLQKIRYDIKEPSTLTFIITFLRDNVEKGSNFYEFCVTEQQITDIFTKALARQHFEKNRLELGMMKIT